MIFRTIISICLLLLATACIQEIDPDSLTETPDLIAVDGRITDQFGPHKVSLQKLSPMSQVNEAPEAVKGAKVTISGGGETFELQETAPGIYETDSSARGQIGQIYTVLIQYDEKSYTASDSLLGVTDFEPIDFQPDTSESGIPFTDFAYIRHQFGFTIPNVWELVIHAPDSIPASLPPLNYTPTADSFDYYTHPKIETNGLFNFLPTHYYGYRFPRKIEHKKYSVSSAYYAYLLALFSETEWRGGLFDTTPANLPSNLSEGATGFFSASAVKEKWYELP